jgi:hypothetical protein
MARPPKNTVDYFPFYCEDGKKMFYIEETYGNDGFATFVKLLRELAKTENHYLDLSNSATMMFLAAKCKVSKEILNAIINDLCELGKFDKELWSENKIIWCQDFINSIQDAYEKRSNSCIDRNSLLSLLHSLGVRKLSKSSNKLSLCSSEGGIKPQTKEKEIKVNNNIENSFAIYISFFNKTFDKDFSVETWSKKAFGKYKAVLKRYPTQSEFGAELAKVCTVIKQSQYHKDENYKYITPEFIVRPDNWEKFLNTEIKQIAKEPTKWTDPSQADPHDPDFLEKAPKNPYNHFAHKEEHERFRFEWKYDHYYALQTKVEF